MRIQCGIVVNRRWGHEGSEPSMFEISMKDFVVTGDFGPVRRGISRDELSKLLGQPDDVEGVSRKRRRPSIWRYGGFEFHFGMEVLSDSLDMVFTDSINETSFRDCAAFSIDPWVLHEGIAHSELETELVKIGVEFSRFVAPWDAGTEVIRTASGVEFGFNLKAGEFRPAVGLNFISHRYIERVGEEA